MSFQFGILTTVTGHTELVIQSVEPKRSAAYLVARGQDGKAAEIRAYSKEYDVNIRALLNASNTTLDAGQTITIDSKNYLVVDFSKPEQNEGWVEVNIAAKTIDDAAITPLSAGTGSGSGSGNSGD